MITVHYGCSVFRRESKLVIQSLLLIFVGDKNFQEYLFGLTDALFWESIERRASAMNDLNLPKLALEYR